MKKATDDYAANPVGENVMSKEISIRIRPFNMTAEDLEFAKREVESGGYIDVADYLYAILNAAFLREMDEAEERRK
jgi:hypothetical protein